MRSSIALPYSVACVGICTFSLMDAAMKTLSDPAQLGALNAMIWRNGVGALLGLGLFLVARAKLPSPQAMRLHLLRGTVAAFMAVTFFWGIARVPLAEAIALSFIAPLITLYLAAVMLGEKIRPRAITASLLGLLGVGVILAGRWGGEPHNADAWQGVVAIFISAILYAYNLILQRQQALAAPPSEIVLFQFLISLAVLIGMGAVLAVTNGADPVWKVAPTAQHWPLIVTSAALSAGSLFLMSWAYARAEAQQLVSVEYTAFIWASLFGWLFFKEALTAFVLGGAVLIIIACLIAARDGGSQKTKKNGSAV